MGTSLAWEKDFPRGYGHTSIAYLKRCPGYEDAKNGNMNAANFVVSQCVKQSRINDLRNKHPNAVLIPVLNKNRLMVKFGMTLAGLLRVYGVAVSVWYLTNSQVIYLLRFASVGNIERKLAKIVDMPCLAR